LFVKGLSYLLANEADVWFCNIEWERQKNAYRLSVWQQHQRNKAPTMQEKH